MLSRTLSTIVLWAAILGSMYYFDAYAVHIAVALVTVLSALTLHEFYDITAKMGLRAFRWTGLFFGVLITGGTYYFGYYFDEPDFQGVLPGTLLVLALIVCCFRVLRERDTSNRVETIAATMLGLLCIPFMLQFLLRLLMGDGENGDNLVLCLWVVAVAKFCDVGALLTGLAIGRHQMAPVISPKKTWEGAVGGVLCSAGVGALIAHFAPNQLPETMTPAVAAIIAVPLAIVGIISDLMESVLKRRADVKDTGTIIPGIGGAFDLTDSLILVAPVAYFIFLFVE